MAFHKDPYNVIIAGVGGQGNVLASLILGRLFVNQGYKVTIGETYGVTQRGGSVMSHVRISSSIQFSPIIPNGAGDLIIALEPVEGLRMLASFGNPDVQFITNTRPVLPMSVLTGEACYPGVPEVLEKLHRLSKRLWTVEATEIALSLNNSILANIALLGAVSGTSALPIDDDLLYQVLEDSLPAAHLALNLKAFHLGREAVREYGVTQKE
jgi:indolepyruvate ferredoxin oxidoreductase beta subunit